jgi:murein DD-endopeptidase MepM/ murein hydrolase activator NlpD
LQPGRHGVPETGSVPQVTLLTTLLLTLSLLFPPAPPATWVWPVSGPQIILLDFVAPPTPWGPGHRGLDLAADSPRVIAPVAGVISFAGLVVDRGVLTITTDAGHKVSLEPVTSLVSTGTRVTQGQHIANLEEGHCVTLCVHLGLRVLEGYRSPRRELGVLQRAVLLPWGVHSTPKT